MTDVAMIGLGLNTDPLRRGEQALDSLGRRGDRTQGTIKRATDRMVSGFRNVASRVFNLRTAIATLAGSAGIGLLVRSNMEAIDELAKFSDTVGDTTENIQAMRRQAELSGVDLRTMDSALQRATRRAAQAADGTGAASDAYDRLGLSAQRVAEMAPTEAFWAQAEAIRNLTSRSEQLRAANEIFGREAEEVIRIIDQGEESFNAIRREMEATGEAISRIDAARIEQANDAITEMRAAFGVIGQQLAIQLAPLISGIAERIRGAANEGVNFEEQVGGAIDSTINGIAFMVDAVEGARRTFRLVGLGGLQAFMEIRRGAMEFAQFIDEAVLERLQSMRRLLRALPGFTGLVADFILPEFDTESLEEDLEQSRRMVEEGREEIRRILAEPMPSEGINRWVREQRAALVDLTRPTGPLAIPEMDIKTLEDYAQEWDNIAEKIGDAGDETDRVDRAQRRLQMTFQSAFEDAIIAGEGLRDVLAGVAQDIARIMLRQAVTEPAGQAMASAFAGAFNFGGARADGGDVQQGVSYLVGERGPEIFTPGQTGAITPNENISNSSNTTVNNNINISADGADPEQLARLTESVRALDRNFERRAVGSMQDARSRGRIR